MILTVFSGCGERIRTNDLRVMSPTSYQLLYPAIFSLLFQSLTIIAQHDKGVNSFLPVKCVSAAGLSGAVAEKGKI